MYIFIVSNDEIWDMIILEKDKTLSYRLDNNMNYSFNTNYVFEKLNRKIKLPKRTDLREKSMCEISEESLPFYSKCIKNCSSEKNNVLGKYKHFLSINHLDSVHFAVFLKELRQSDTYRHHYILNFLDKYRLFSNHNQICEAHSVKFLKTPIVCLHNDGQQIIDYAWNVRLSRDIVERMHMDTLMSWLSTLGGACSALGDADSEFSEKAGQISLQQMRIAIKLGDPSIISRCRLYASISFIQKGYFKKAAEIIYHEYKWAKLQPKELVDIRILRMCRGIWTKLQYEYIQHKAKSITCSRSI